MPSRLHFSKHGAQSRRCRHHHRAATTAALLFVISHRSSSPDCNVEALALPTHRRLYDGLSPIKSETHLHSSVGWSMDDAAERPGLLAKVLRSRRLLVRREKEEPAPFGPVPRVGSSSSDVARHRQHPLAALAGGAWSNVRTGVRGARMGVVGAAVNLNGLLRGGRDARGGDTSNGSTSSDGFSFSILRIGGGINRRLRRRRAARAAASLGLGAVSESAVVSAQMETLNAGVANVSKSSRASGSTAVEVVDRSDTFSLPIMNKLLQRPSLDGDAISAAYEAASTLALASIGGSKLATAVATKPSTKAPSRFGETETYVIETPLFPIILPKTWELPSASASAAQTPPTTAETSSATLEISVAVERTASAVADAAEAKPSPQLLQAATLPLLPKSLMGSFTGREFYHPETVEALAQTGIAMALVEGSSEWVDWSGEKKTDGFLRAHGTDGRAGATKEWYTALDSSREVLVWSGKSVSRDGHGAELPFIKTTSIVNQSPKYLAELLMDSSRVKVYNKMSLGRTDEIVFQTRIDTHGGSFGDGESKVVRNLTKPPMVSSVIEFVTFMHARKLRPSDLRASSSGRNDGDSLKDAGYVVVSRAVTGSKLSSDSDRHNGDKLVRSEILLGVNLLRSVPGEPIKTEMTSVTHVHSPMIPLMLAKNAGVKGAVDFVRDIRALP